MADSLTYVSQETAQLLFIQTAQVTLVALLVWPLARLASRRSPHLAHALWLLLLIKCVTPPLVSSPTSLFSWINAAANVTASEAAERPNVETSAAASRPSNQAAPTAMHSGLPEVRIEPPAIAVPADLSQPNAIRPPSDTVLQRAPNRPAPQPDLRTATFWATSWATSWAIPSWGHVAQRCLTLIWLLGLAGYSLLTIVRWFCVRNHLSRSTAAPANLQELADEIQTSTGAIAAGRIQVRVADDNFGPAVVGLFRPQILLPACLLDTASSQDLKILLTHEIIHVRRGDLWWAALQLVAGGLFWFHPLVRLANRQLTRESEKCCDEQTVATLQCTPQQYAAGLIHVLEHQVRLRELPLVPGVRRSDITSARLERVMKFGTGLKNNTPRSAWLLLLLGAVTLLPGATLVSGKTRPFPQAKQEPQTPLPPADQTTSDVVVSDSRSSTELKQIKPTSSEQWSVQTYDISIVKQRFTAEVLEQLAEGKPLPYSLIELLAGPQQPYPYVFTAMVTERTEQQLNVTRPVRLGGVNPTIKIVADKLAALAPPESHARIATAVKHFEEFGFRQLLLETSLGNVSPEFLKAQNFDWSLLPIRGAEVVAPDRFATQAGVAPTELPPPSPFDPLNPPDSESKNSGRSSVQRDAPVFYTVVSSEEFLRMIGSTNDLPGNRFAQAPLVTVFNGQTATITDRSMRPFVVGVKADDKPTARTTHQPIIKLFPDGVQVRLNATLGDNSIELACELLQSQIVKVETEETLLKSEPGATVSVQVPQVDRTHINITQTIPEKGVLLVATARGSGKDRDFILLSVRGHTKPGSQQLTGVENTRKPSASGFSQTFRPSGRGQANFVKQPVYYAASDGRLMARQMNWVDLNRHRDKRPFSLKADGEGDNWVAEALLKELGCPAKLTGKFELKIEGNEIQLSGSQVSLGNSDSEKLTADQAVLTLKNKQCWQIELIGNARYTEGTKELSSQQMVYETEDLNWEFPIGKSFTMTGQASFRDSNPNAPQSHAERIEFREQGIRLTGKAKLTFGVDGQASKFEGETIELTESDNQLSIFVDGQAVTFSPNSKTADDVAEPADR